MYQPAPKTFLGKVLILCALAFVLGGRHLLAQGGAPDPNFQVQQVAYPYQICMQSDGKIVIPVSYLFSTGPTSSNPSIIRLNTDGSVDSTFSGSDENLAGAPSQLTSANGYIYLVSYTYVNGNGPTGSVLQRYQESTGQLDATFAAVTVPGTTVAGYVVQPNGQILVWGDALYRRNADGSIDPSFTSPDSSLSSGITGMSVASTGNIYVWGNFTTIAGATRNGIARLGANGALDTSFVPATNAGSYAFHLLQEPSGSVLASIWDPVSSRHTMIRLQAADGSADPAFQSPTFTFLNTDGARLTNYQAIETSDQKIVVWGPDMVEADGVSVSGYTRFNSDGTLDTAFVTNAASTTGQVGTILVQPDGKLVLTGIMNQGISPVPMVRLNVDGTADPSFDMLAENQLSALTSYQALEPILQPDGQIVTALIPISTGGSDEGGSGVVIVVGPQPTPPPPPPDLIARYQAYGNYPPHRPTTLTILSISDQVTVVNWNSVATATSYQIERDNGGQWVVIGTVAGTVTSFNDTSADGVTNYSYRVEALNANGTSLPSPATAAPQPQPFDSFAATAVSPTRVSLAWSPAQGAGRYQIYRLAGTVNTNYVADPSTIMTLLATVPYTATAFIDDTASPAQTYTYAVVAKNLGGIEPTVVISVTTPAAVPPVTPARVGAASAAPGEIEVTWEASPASDGYIVERSADGVSGWQVVANLGYGATTFLDTTGLSLGQTYSYRITAFNAEGSSAVSTTASGLAPTWSWLPPGTLDASFAPIPPLTGVTSAKIAPSGSVFYSNFTGDDEPDTLGEVSATGAALAFSPWFNQTNYPGVVSAFAPLASGDILASTFQNNALFLARMTATGAYDSTFNAPLSADAPVQDIVVLPDGDILAVFIVYDGLAYYNIERLLPDGTPDSTFSNDNVYTGLSAPLVQSDGNIILAAKTSGVAGTAIIRLLTNGQPDPTFGNAGQVTISGGNVNAQVLQSDDSIVLGGNFTSVDDGSGPVARNSLVRLTPDGKVDPTFNIGSGVVPTVTSSANIYDLSSTTSQQVNLLAVDPQDRILVQGKLSQFDTIPCASLIRLLPNGQFDPSFILPTNFDSSNFVLSGDATTFYAGSTLQRYFYNPTMTTAPMSFGPWETQKGSTGALTDCPQNDTVPNLLKYVYDVDPSKSMGAADRAALPVMGMATIGGMPYLTLTHRQNPAMTGVTVRLQTSADLQTWTTVPNPNITEMGTDPTTADPIVRMGVQATGANQYIRLSVTSP